jgi:RHS repeat-associated protein
VNGVTEVYTVDSGDKLTQVSVSGVPTKTFGYDGAGRTTSIQTSAGTTSFTYDFESRVTGITYPNNSTNSFNYNGLDTRVGKTDSAGTATFRRMGAGVTAPVLGDGSASFTPGVSERRGSTSSFYGADYLGTNSSLYSSSETVSATRQYDAFGNMVGSSGSSANPFGFAGNWGYQNDPDSGLMLLGHRYYDASTGRFLTRDPIKDGRNWYAYCGNGPVRAVDPNGLFILYIGGGASATGTLAHGAVDASAWIDPITGNYGTIETVHLGFGIGAMASLDGKIGISLETPIATGWMPSRSSTLAFAGEIKEGVGGGVTAGGTHDPSTQKPSLFAELSFGIGGGTPSASFSQSYSWVKVHGNVYDDVSNAIACRKRSSYHFPAPENGCSFTPDEALSCVCINWRDVVADCTAGK